MSLRNQAIKEHCEKYYNNATIATYEKNNNNDLLYYTLEELEHVGDNWFPLCCYKDKDTNKLIYGGSDGIIHTYTQGETGCGKTTRLVMQTIKALSHTKNKPSFVIVDYHGEIYKNMYNQLKDRGYDVKILNCDNPYQSDTYNPFDMMSKTVEESEKIPSEVAHQIRNISKLIHPIRALKDPIWDQGSCSYQNGLILDCYEAKLKKEILSESINLYNICERHFWLRSELTRSGGRDILDIPYYDKKGLDCLSIKKMMSVTNNAEKTRDSYFGVFENNIDEFLQTSVFQLSSNSTINLEEIIEKPSAIFIQSGTTSVGELLVSLLVNDLYNLILKKSKESSSYKPNHFIHCFIDEFANCNFGTGDEFIKMLTTSRKFGLFWHMYLQCDAQLDKKYNDTNIGNIIRSNATEIFMGSQDYATLKRFASSCGKITVENLNSVMNQKDVELEVIDLITPEKLALLPSGYMYIKRNRKPLLYSYFEAYYNCEEFIDSIKEVSYPVNDFDYESTRFVQSDYLKDKQVERQKAKLKPLRKELISLLKVVRTDSGNYLFALDLNEPEVDYNLSCYQKMVSEESMKMTVNNVGAEFLASLEVGNMEELYLPMISKIDRVEYLNKLKTFTCIPEEIYEFVETKGESYLPGENHLKFSFVENFIMNNKFKSKATWMEGFKKEYGEIKKQKIFPPVINRIIFHSIEMLEELTLDNIRLIKKTIKENKD